MIQESLEQEAVVGNTGVFTLSLDFELIWGTLDLFGPDRFREACLRERALIDPLLDLFTEFEIPATWCVLGHLFLGSCESGDGKKHPEISEPHHDWCRQGWFAHDPCSTEEAEPIFYGRSLVNKIMQCKVQQEIGCHSFSHVIFGDDGCSEETAESELAACLKLAEERNIDMVSFAFPRNRVGHLPLLEQFGFRVFRGPDAVWYEQGNRSGWIRRLFHLWDVVRAAQPPVVLPKRITKQLWDVPGSMIYFPMHGFRRWLPLSWRVSRAIKGLNAAVRQKKVFHLWFHPTNLADQSERMFAGLRQIFEQVRMLRENGMLTVLPMRSLVPEEITVTIPNETRQ